MDSFKIKEMGKWKEILMSLTHKPQTRGWIN